MPSQPDIPGAVTVNYMLFCKRVVRGMLLTGEATAHDILNDLPAGIKLDITLLVGLYCQARRPQANQKSNI